MRLTLDSARRRAALASAVVLLALAGCTSGKDSTSAPTVTVTATPAGSGSSSAAASHGATPAAVISSLKGHRISPAEPVTVRVTDGKLTSVVMKNPAGRRVSGAISADGSSWHNTEVLGYAKTYRIVATAENGAGQRVVKHSRVTTVSPQNQTQPYLDTVYGASIEKDATYGVGMIVNVAFDEPIPDKAAAEKALQVTTSPHVDGAWYWLDDSHAHWRPERYYQPGTTVTVAAKVYGKDLGNGLYGQSDKSVSFKIGQKRLSVANAKTHHVKVYFDDNLVRTMPTSMGMGGSTTGKNGQTIYFWTMPGTYTVLGHENPAIMSSDSYGLPKNSPYGYGPEKIYYATKISTDGIYLHELDTTVWAQGNQNVSHGCLNLNYTNAKWYYNHSRVGDLVRVVHSGGPALQVWQGGDWSVPWATWEKGGAAA